MIQVIVRRFKKSVHHVRVECVYSAVVTVGVR